MKSIKKIILIFILIFIVFTQASFADTGKVNVSATRIREDSNTDSAIITNIYYEDEVEILDEKDGWYKVKYNGDTGYVKKEYLTVEKKKDSNTSNNSSNSASNQSNVSNTNTNKVSNTNASKNTTNTNTNTNTSTNTTTNNTASNNVNNSNQETTTENSTEVTTSSEVNLKNLPNMVSITITRLEKEKKLQKISEIGNWIQVTDGLITGWIPKAKTENTESNKPKDNSNTTNDNKVENNTNTIDSKKVENKTNNNSVNTNQTSENNSGKKGKVNVETANVRETASTTAEIIGFLDYDDQVDIVSEQGDWYQVKSSDVSGYVSKRLITIVDDSKVSSRSLTETRENSENSEEDTTVVEPQLNEILNDSFSNQKTDLGNEIAEYAKNYLGYKYVSGGKTPTSGFDCSGFTKYVYSNFGFDLGNTAASQTSLGTEVGRDNLEVGDLLLFNNEGNTSIGHTGIYLGNGEFVHSANPERGVVIDNLNSNSYYNTRFVTARRFEN